ncbi:restriction endonuclease [Candidatus Saccharibacteria bacterium]|jgi:HJR/Mrr/RecB family endonuclease|nr:MAG: restriction endonuclease [Candidatus Saccharibacteria bacterium]
MVRLTNMSRYSRSHDDTFTFAILILVGTAAWQHRSQLIHIAYIVLFITACTAVLVWSIRHIKNRFRIEAGIDTMTGLEFEHFIAGLLRQNRFRNVRLTERYDYGVDIIGEKDGVRWGIQVKRHSGLVKASAVRQVVTGLKVYGCDRAMVITNSNFSTVAWRLARANDCVLIDRGKFEELMRQKCIL